MADEDTPAPEPEGPETDPIKDGRAKFYQQVDRDTQGAARDHLNQLQPTRPEPRPTPVQPPAPVTSQVPLTPAEESSRLAAIENEARQAQLKRDAQRIQRDAVPLPQPVATAAHPSGYQAYADQQHPEPVTPTARQILTHDERKAAGEITQRKDPGPSAPPPPPRAPSPAPDRPDPQARTIEQYGQSRRTESSQRLTPLERATQTNRPGFTGLIMPGNQNGREDAPPFAIDDRPTWAHISDTRIDPPEQAPANGNHASAEKLAALTPAEMTRLATLARLEAEEAQPSDRPSSGLSLDLIARASELEERFNDAGEAPRGLSLELIRQAAEFSALQEAEAHGAGRYDGFGREGGADGAQEPDEARREMTDRAQARQAREEQAEGRGDGRETSDAKAARANRSADRDRDDGGRGR